MRPVIFIPTYNEAPNLERLVREIREFAPEASVVVVDDQSPDGTGEIADRIAAADDAVRVVHRDPPRGRGLAGRDGYLEALRLGADVILEMDADFSHDPRLLPRFFAAIENGADVVLGSRFVAGGSDLDRSRWRRVVTMLANTYIRWMLGVPVGDCNSGYRCFRRQVLEAIRPESLTSVGPSIVQEVLFRVHRAGARIEEIPLEFIDRKDGESKLGLGLLLDGYVMILRLRILALLWEESLTPLSDPLARNAPLRRLAVASVLACALFLACFHVTNLDIGGHVTVGREIILTKSIPKTDFFSHTAQGRSYPVHQWFGELVLLGVEHVSGPSGLIALRMLVVLIGAILLYRNARREDAPIVVAAAIVLLLIAAARPRFFVRPFLVTLVFRALQVCGSRTSGRGEPGACGRCFSSWGCGGTCTRG